jgi:site-specific recombinase XerD
MEEYPHLPDYARSFIRHLQEKGREKSTIKRYYYDLLDFFAWLRVIQKNDDKRTLQSLQANHLKEYFRFLSEQREYSAATSKRVMTVVKRLFQFLQDHGVLAKNPFYGLEHMYNTDTHFHENDFIREEEFHVLVKILSSYENLTEKQQKFRHLLIRRNETIAILLYRYGLTLQELTNIEMKDVEQKQSRLIVRNKDNKRSIELEKTDRYLINSYLNNIPAPVRPREFTKDRFLIAFDYQRGTFRFDYSNHEPKPLTVIAVQKMLRQELRRAGLRKGISAHHLRRSAILNFLKAGNSEEETQKRFGLKSLLTVQRYANYLREEKSV